MSPDVKPPAPPQSQDEEEVVYADDAVIGRAFRWSAIAVVILALVGGGAAFLMRRPKPVDVVVQKAVEPPRELVQDTAKVPAVRFTDVTEASGVRFRQVNGATGKKLLPETMGGGVAFLDYDGDGDSDLLFVSSSTWPGDPAVTPRPTPVLYQNDGSGKFSDVTQKAGLDVSLYGMGVAVGDYDNDGDSDLFLTAVGPNHLFRNDGGRFTDVTRSAGVAGADTSWSSSAGFLDYDNDGDLDLFVANYVQWSREIDEKLAFSLNGTDRAYGPPKSFLGSHSYLYRNDGPSFADVSAEAGIQVTNKFAADQPAGKALALAFVDIDEDGWIDIFVANDTVQNFLFRNVQGKFEEQAVTAGVAYDTMGNARGAMGVDIADYRNQGELAIAVGNFANEATSFFVEQGSPWEFADMADVEGIGSPSRLHLKFGVLFLDYDLDARLDLLQANGHLEEEINSVQPSQHYEQSAQLFWNVGPDARSCYVEVDAKTLGDLSKPIVGRGAAFADIDGDGDLDVTLTQSKGAPLLLRNDQATGHHWLAVKLHGKKSNRDAIGAWVELTADGVTQRRQVMPTRSYLSQVELPVTFGLGTATKVDSLKITWPGGKKQDAAVSAIDRRIVIAEAD